MNSLTKQEVKNVIDGKRTTERIPNLCSFWIYPDRITDEETKLKWSDWLNKQIYDMDIVNFRLPKINTVPENWNCNKEYCWLPSETPFIESSGLDSTIWIKDWEDTDFIENMYAKFPTPDMLEELSHNKPDSEKYIVFQWFYWLFERHWSLRGMENALTDFLLYPEEVHRFYQKLTDFYIGIMERAKREFDVDAIWTSDDIGTQTGPFFSLEVFRTFFKPYYKQMIDKAHELGMHFWLHTCGNIEMFLEDFIEIGLDVIHPIQKYTMDEAEIAKKYGDRICILAGFDVQQTIPYGTPEDVRKEVRYLIDTFDRPEGRFMITMGNANTEDWKLENLVALYDEIATYPSTP